jgi:hypothetical protein
METGVPARDFEIWFPRTRTPSAICVNPGGVLPRGHRGRPAGRTNPEEEIVPVAYEQVKVAAPTGVSKRVPKTSRVWREVADVDEHEGQAGLALHPGGGLTGGGRQTRLERLSAWEAPARLRKARAPRWRRNPKAFEAGNSRPANKHNAKHNGQKAQRWGALPLEHRIVNPVVFSCYLYG